MSVAVDANTGKAYKDADGKYVAKNVEFTTGAVKKGTVFPETTAMRMYTYNGLNDFWANYDKGELPNGRNFLLITGGARLGESSPT